MNTEFALGDKVESTISDQGLIPGGIYEVVGVAFGKFGVVVYTIRPWGRSDENDDRCVVNGHLVLRRR